MYTGHRSQYSLINYTALDMEKGSAITQALLRSKNGPVVPDDIEPPPVVQKSPEHSPIRVINRKRGRGTDNRSFDLGVDNLLQNDKQSKIKGK